MSSVTLINHTQDAEWLLIFTKRTRLKMNPDSMTAVRQMSDEDVAGELEYIANTIRSSWEFINYTFLIENVSRAFTHQFVRTRTGSYAQQSMRVVDMDTFGFVMPKRWAENSGERQHAYFALQSIESAMRDLRQIGAATEDIRSLLPTNVATNIVAQFNLRALADLVRSREGGRTQDEYRDVVRGMADCVLAVHPWTQAFLYPQPRDYFAEIEAFAEEQFGGDLATKGRLLKIIDAMRGIK